MPKNYKPKEKMRVKQILEEAKAKTDIGKKHIAIWKMWMQRKKAKELAIPVPEVAPDEDEDVIAYMEKVTAEVPEGVEVHEIGGTTVITAPDYETATHWGNWYFNRVYDYAKRNAIEAYILNAGYANALNFHSSIRNNDAKFVCGVGHGDSYIFTGQNAEPLLLLGDGNTRITSFGRIWCLLSCVVGALLGERMVHDYGAKAFIGYSESFYFLADEANYPNFWAKFFFDSHNAIDYALLDGETVADAVQIGIDTFKYNIEIAPEYAKPYLQHDLDYLVMFGDFDATIYDDDEPEPPPGWCCIFGPAARVTYKKLSGLFGRIAELVQRRKQS